MFVIELEYDSGVLYASTIFFFSSLLIRKMVFVRLFPRVPNSRFTQSVNQVGQSSFPSLRTSSITFDWLKRTRLTSLIGCGAVTRCKGGIRVWKMLFCL